MTTELDGVALTITCKCGCVFGVTADDGQFADCCEEKIPVSVTCPACKAEHEIDAAKDCCTDFIGER